MKRKYVFILFCSIAVCCLLLSCKKENACSPDDSTLILTGEHIELAVKIADRWISLHPPETMAWNWEPAVLMYALAELYKNTGDAKYLEYYRNWVDYNIDKGYFLMMSDHVIPSAIAADLYKRTCDEKYKKVIDDIYFYLTEAAPKTPEGGISHLGTLVPGTPQLWIDSLFMFGMPMIKAFEATGERRYLELISEQFIIFADLLQDNDTGFFRHAWINQQRVPEEPVFWARGNSWVLVSLTELLTVMPGDYADKEKLTQIYSTLLNAVDNSQDIQSGLWWTVLNRPGETYLETSASALFTYGITRGINKGIIDRELYYNSVERGIAGIKSRISFESGQPVVTGISKGTQPGGFDNYKNVETGNDIPYGVGGVILSLVEWQKI